jgi:hypothetical protein
MNSVAALIRALRGPVMLITLGCLFLLRFDGPGWSIKTTWPLLIIVFGVMKLLESLAARTPANPGGVS